MNRNIKNRRLVVVGNGKTRAYPAKVQDRQIHLDLIVNPIAC
jgi:hypothetical protein